MKKLNNDIQSSFVLTMQRYEQYSSYTNLFSEPAVFFSKQSGTATSTPNATFLELFPKRP